MKTPPSLVPMYNTRQLLSVHIPGSETTSGKIRKPPTYHQDKKNKRNPLFFCLVLVLYTGWCGTGAPCRFLSCIAVFVWSDQPDLGWHFELEYKEAVLPTRV